jgi:hypothetical protein
LPAQQSTCSSHVFTNSEVSIFLFFFWEMVHTYCNCSDLLWKQFFLV